MKLSWISLALFVAVIVIAIWASDKIGLDGERTVYTVRCEGGDWQDGRCTGYLAPGERYRFRASRSRQEVMYWIVGSRIPSVSYRDCTVKDRGNWSCKVAADQPHTITREMVNGQARAFDEAREDRFFSVPKWKWWLLRLGLQISDVDS